MHWDANRDGLDCQGLLQCCLWWRKKYFLNVTHMLNKHQMLRRSVFKFCCKPSEITQEVNWDTWDKFCFVLPTSTSKKTARLFHSWKGWLPSKEWNGHGRKTIFNLWKEEIWGEVEWQLAYINTCRIWMSPTLQLVPDSTQTTVHQSVIPTDMSPQIMLFACAEPAQGHDLTRRTQSRISHCGENEQPNYLTLRHVASDCLTLAPLFRNLEMAKTVWKMNPIWQPVMMKVQGRKVGARTLFAPSPSQVAMCGSCFT